MLNLKNTLDGYLKNVEVIGNTVQDTNNLANIRSVGDKVEGQELYKIDVVSCGKNLFKMCKDNEIHRNSYNGIVEIQHNGFSLTDTRNGDMAGFVMKCKPNTEYVVTFNDVSSTKVQKFFRAYTEYPIDSNANYNINVGTATGSSIKLTTTSNCNYIFFGVYGSNGTSTIKDIQVEEGTQATSYEPYQEQKLEILSPVQLEKVGDVADRIICKDGVWGVEKNVKTCTITGSSGENIVYSSTYDRIVFMDLSPRNETISLSSSGVVTHFTWSAILRLGIKDISNNGVTSIESARAWLQSNPQLVKYIGNQPQFIPLPHDQQIKLRTFAGQTNIAFLTEIPGQIKAQVPKSLGATVNTHTEQIADLHNSLDRVKKLEETTVSTIETVSNFTTVDATSNGYFEDVKLEGKTLVNLVGDKEEKVFNSMYLCSDTKGLDLSLFKSNTIYTLITVGLDKVEITSLCNNKGDVYIYLNKSGKITTFTTPNDMSVFTSPIRVFAYSSSNNRFVEGDEQKIKFIILEGDHTNNPPSYFEGLMSVGQDVEEVSVESSAKNIITTISDAHSVKPIYTYLQDSEIYPYLQYFTEVKDYNACNNVFEFYYLTSGGLWINLGTFNKEEALKVLNKRIAECEGSLNTKPLLYYNPTTETWEKPILREWDTIEKHSDGKYYYHKRSGEVVLNGSENWLKWEYEGFPNGYLFKNTSITDSCLTRGEINVYSDKYNSIIHTDNSSILDKSIVCASDGSVCIADSSVTTVSDLINKLQNNQTIVVYRLKQEKIYECANIDLMTYSGETNYIINSGAISPKSLLKVHNNISNVVKILQEKVSLLENTFIAGLRSVLSGDMYSLATILYPEDFEQNDNTEQDIMVIPE